MCHNDEDEKFLDAGGPTFWRIARLQTQMSRDNENTKDGGTRATTQEPQGKWSVKTAILSCILYRAVV